ncbi:MAG TPA: acyltransferase family protein [Chitinolyticbacter sp.]|nr:acyltransferase family protein [Chitinolyticbacter sp.]
MTTPAHRQPQLDLIRVLATFAVVWLHVSANVVIYRPDAASSAWWTANVADALVRWCVPVFVMLSGALLLPGAGQMSAADFYRKRLPRLLWPLVGWTAFYLALRAGTDPHFSWAQGWRDVVKGVPYYHLWYLYMTLGLYLAAPFIARVTAPAEMRLLMGLALAIAATESLIGSGQASVLTRFVPYVGYFVAGHYFALRPWRPAPSRAILLALACGALIALTTGLLLPTLGKRAWLLMYAYTNPLVIVMSLALWLALLQCRADGWACHPLVRALSRLSLGIYAIHPLWLLVLGRNGLHGHSFNPAWAIALTSIAAFILSAISAALLSRLPLLRRLVE